MIKLIFFILAILILIYIFSPNKFKDNILCSPVTLYNKSIGTFDGPAKAAFKKLQDTPNKNPNDKLLEAYILSESILEGETPLKSPLTMAAMCKYNEALNVPIPNIETHLLDTAENFNNRLTTQIDLFGGNEEYDNFGFLIGNLDNNIHTARQIQATEIKKQQSEISQNSVDVVNNYLEAVKSHTSDPQNSHDTNVSHEIKKTLDIIERENTIDKPDIFSEIDKYIKTADISEDKKQKAKNSLSVIKNRNEEVFAAGRNEIAVIKLVWLRAEHPNNKINEDNIKSAVIDALIDITTTNPWNETGTVCPNGRISRIVGALSALDFNNQVGSLETQEQINNYILEQAAQTYNKYINDNPGPIVDALNTKEGPPDSPELEKFNTGLKAAIDKMLIENNATQSMKEKIYIGFSW